MEFETPIEMTQHPGIGIELVNIMNDICEDYYQKHDLISEIRLTPNDIREIERPPKLRSTKLLDPMMELFEKGAEAGGNLLSIESTGGKEISDDALMMCNMKQFVFSQAVLGVRDMHMLWEKMVDVADRTGRIPGGDTACGFANTAMVLAPVNVIEISREIVKGSNYIDATVSGCLKGMEIIETALEKDELKQDEREEVWIID